VLDRGVFWWPLFVHGPDSGLTVTQAVPHTYDTFDQQTAAADSQGRWLVLAACLWSCFQLCAGVIIVCWFQLHIAFFVVPEPTLSQAQTSGMGGANECFISISVWSLCFAENAAGISARFARRGQAGC
jgi:hypothetical protein